MPSRELSSLSCSWSQPAPWLQLRDISTPLGQSSLRILLVVLIGQSRDRAVSYSAWISKVHPTLKVPLNAILCTVFVTAVLCGVLFNSSTAQRTMMCFSTACIHITYVASLGCLILKRLRHEELPPAKWSLGRHGLLINLIAICYCSWAAFWSFWTGQPNVRGTNFNWTPALFVLVVVLAVGMFTAARWRITRRVTSRERSAFTLSTLSARTMQ